MLTRYKWLMASLALLLFSAPVRGGSVYVLSVNLATDDQQFGTVDLGTGAFQQIRSAAAEEYRGLVPISNGSLLTLGFDGNLTAINPMTGFFTVIGPTGLSDCSTPSSPCGPTSAGAFAALGGIFYATDFSQNLYRVDPATGNSTLIGPTGLPAVPFSSHFTSNPDGTLNVMSAALFAANGSLYATFSTDRLDPISGNVTPGILDNLYRINPNTGLTTIVAPTAQDLTAVIQVSGISYAFNVGTQQLLSLNLANGGTNLVAGVGPGPMYVEGAASTPEPFSMALAGIGIAAVIVRRSRRRA
jgi:outer membrane protein assembly factor BamB